MNAKRFVGFIIILIGILFSFSSFAITGAVISGSTIFSNNLIGAFIVLVGLMILATS